MLYQRQYIEAARRFAEAPVPDTTLTAALDLFDSIANDPAVHLSMQLEPGDIQFVHNHSMLHDRTSFLTMPSPPSDAICFACG
ncbi:MAG: TauD/TfdA family dioxygenase [Acidimicrobiales bacterium]